MTSLDNARYYPASANEVLSAVVASVARIGGKVDDVDDLSRTVSLTAPPHRFPWGAGLAAQVLPVGDGAYVRIDGTKRRSLRLLDEISQTLQH